MYAFVRSSLRDDVKPIKFILCMPFVCYRYISNSNAHDISESDQPPSRDLKVSDLEVRDLTLAQLHLTPSSVLLLRFEDETLNRAFNLAFKNRSSHDVMQGQTSQHP